MATMVEMPEIIEGKTGKVIHLNQHNCSWRFIAARSVALGSSSSRASNLSSSAEAPSGQR